MGNVCCCTSRKGRSRERSDVVVPNVSLTLTAVTNNDNVRHQHPSDAPGKRRVKRADPTAFRSIPLPCPPGPKHVSPGPPGRVAHGKLLLPTTLPAVHLFCCPDPQGQAVLPISPLSPFHRIRQNAVPGQGDPLCASAGSALLGSTDVPLMPEDSVDAFE
jgi:hypothetical protein